MTTTEPVTPETATPRTPRPDPAAPAWMLDVAEAVMAARLRILSDTMYGQGEDNARGDLWSLRVSQLDSLLRAGKVLAVNRGSEKGKSARFADFYTARYDDIGSNARALIVETDEAMQIRPVSDRSVIIARA
jgi:hypothetical protein